MQLWTMFNFNSEDTGSKGVQKIKLSWYKKILKYQFDFEILFREVCKIDATAIYGTSDIIITTDNNNRARLPSLIYLVPHV